MGCCSERIHKEKHQDPELFQKIHEYFHYTHTKINIEEGKNRREKKYDKKQTSLW